MVSEHWVVILFWKIIEYQIATYAITHSFLRFNGSLSRVSEFQWSIIFFYYESYCCSWIWALYSGAWLWTNILYNECKLTSATGLSCVRRKLIQNQDQLKLHCKTSACRFNKHSRMLIFRNSDEYIVISLSLLRKTLLEKMKCSAFNFFDNQSTVLCHLISIKSYIHETSRCFACANIILSSYNVCESYIN